MHTLLRNWVPPKERTKFMTAYVGSPLGMSIFYPIFACIIVNLSWEWAFYLCGICGVIWFIFWQYFAFDKPILHPRIDPNELKYIQLTLDKTTTMPIRTVRMCTYT